MQSRLNYTCSGAVRASMLGRELCSIAVSKMNEEKIIAFNKYNDDNNDVIISHNIFKF